MYCSAMILFLNNNNNNLVLALVKELYKTEKLTYFDTGGGTCLPKSYRSDMMSNILSEPAISALAWSTDFFHKFWLHIVIVGN